MQTDLLMTDVTVVIRSVGERTEAECRNLIAQQVPQENIIIVSNAPFSATLADSYRAGIERGLAWTLCVDADVLLRRHAVSEMLNVACDLPAEACEVQGLMLDKFVGGPRTGGTKLYRTSLLSRALELIPDEGIDVRPEYYTLCRMEEQGYPWISTPLVVALHGFEQYYRDIFRTCFVHAHKHSYLLPLFVDYWRRMCPHDGDYQVALLGLAAGIVETDSVRIDTRKFPRSITGTFPDAGLCEKEDLLDCSISSEDVERIIAQWVEPEEYRKAFPTRSGLTPKQPKSRSE